MRRPYLRVHVDPGSLRNRAGSGRWEVYSVTLRQSITDNIENGNGGRRKQVTGIDKNGALQFTVNWKGIFHIENGIKFSPKRVTSVIMRAEIAFAEAAHGGAATIKETFVDWNCRDVGGSFLQRPDQAGAGT